jgi:hypothetical protein
VTSADTTATEDYDQSARSRLDRTQREELTRRSWLIRPLLNHSNHTKTHYSGSDTEVNKRWVTGLKDSEFTKIFDKRYDGHATSVVRGSGWRVAAQAVVIKGVKAASGVRKLLSPTKRCHSCIVADILPASRSRSGLQPLCKIQHLANRQCPKLPSRCRRHIWTLQYERTMTSLQ